MGSKCHNQALVYIHQKVVAISLSLSIIHLDGSLSHKQTIGYNSKIRVNKYMLA